MSGGVEYLLHLEKWELCGSAHGQRQTAKISGVLPLPLQSDHGELESVSPVLESRCPHDLFGPAE